ncbi:hypothetical protein FS837_006705 [Tulasnella sp. UAMH 9824]|nr:hypothetical protein FS837_006705 [Tulasnella sp. UAMH 9824]
MDANEQTALQRSSFSSVTGTSTQQLDQDNDHRPSATEPELLITDTNPRRRLFGFIPTAFVVFITLGSVSLILGWLLTRQYVNAQGGKGLNAAIRNGSFIVYEGQAPAAGAEVTTNLTGFYDFIADERAANPVNLALQMRWDAHKVVAANEWGVGQADVVVDIQPSPFITLYTGCNVTFSNVTVQYDPSSNSWEMLLEEPSSDHFTSVMRAPGLWQLATEKLAAEMMSIAMTEMAPNVTAALNQHLARMMLGVAVGTLQPAEATDVMQIVPTLLGQYPVGPVMILITLLLLYALLAILIFTSSWLTQDETIMAASEKHKQSTPEEQSVLNLTQRWLVDPLPLVATAFPREDGKDVQRTVADSALDMVYDGNGPDERLSIGLQEKDGFGLRKRGDRRYSD